MPRPKAHAPPYSHRRGWRVPEARAALNALVASGLSVSAFAEREGPPLMSASACAGFPSL